MSRSLWRRALVHLLRDPEAFSRYVIGVALRPYQATVMRGVVEAVTHHTGDVITVMFARQMGKNEVSAHLECYLMNLYQRRGGTIVKAAPTATPQVAISRRRLEGCLANWLNHGEWASHADVLTLGRAATYFVSAHEEAAVMGLTASLLLEIDEAQDVDTEKYQRDFRPMASATNATTVLYGTAWTGDTLLEQQAALNQERETRLGRRVHYAYDWQTLAEILPAYRTFVEAERERLGESHPLFQTQYCLKPIAAAGAFLRPDQRARLVGNHPRRHQREDDEAYVAGIDLAGEDEPTAGLSPRRDAVVVTVARVEYPSQTTVMMPYLRIVEHYWWTGRRHPEVYADLVHLLGTVWACRRIVVDASGVGAGVASFLQATLGPSVVEQFIFTSRSKSDLAFAFLAAVNTGRVTMYRSDAYDETAAEFWRQVENARTQASPRGTLNFFVPESLGHDDFLISAALCVWAARGLMVTPSAAAVPHPLPYHDGQY